MNLKTSVAWITFVFMLAAGNVWSQTNEKTQYSFAIEWASGGGSGSLSAEYGTIEHLNGIRNIRTKGESFKFKDTTGGRIECQLDSANVAYGPDATLIHVHAPQGSFSFFLRDVNTNTPIYIPDYRVVVIPEDDIRSYTEVERDILARKNRTKIQRIESEPEVSFDIAAKRTRNSNVPIWLGLSRDIRMFEITEELPDGMLEDKTIRPIFSSSPVVLPETNSAPVYYRYALGRGVGVMDNIKRNLENGVLPIYHSHLIDDDIH